MTSDNNELDKLFSDKQLQPSSSFERKLESQLSPKNERKHFGIFAKIGLSLAVSLLIIGASVMLPSTKNTNNFVLIRDLYASALADELPQDEQINFWNISESTLYGEQSPLCTNRESGYEVNTKTLIYNNQIESAIYTKSTDSNILPYMRYSDSSDLLAYDEISYFGKEKSSFITQYLVNTTLTDENGNDLAKDAKTEKKNEGEYTIYASLTTKPDDLKNYIEGCSKLRIKIVIDAQSGLYRSVEIYNSTNSSSITSDNLSFSLIKTVDSSSAENFSDIIPVFNMEGFDLEKAKQTNLQNDYITESNKEAGYEFSYKKSLFGKAELTTKKNEEGEIASYSYSFTKQPEVRLEIFTAFSDIDLDIDKMIADRNLTIIDDYGVQTYDEPNFGEITSRQIHTKNEQTKYGMYITGKPYITYVEVEGPNGLGEYTKYDEYAPDFPTQVDEVFMLASVGVFLQNGEPLTGL